MELRTGGQVGRRLAVRNQDDRNEAVRGAARCVSVVLLAVLTVALNALLMLAYLPWYRGVLEGGQLADGEGPDAGHNYASLYANPLGNAPASAYPAAALVLVAAAAFYWFVVLGLNSTTGLVVLAIPAAILAIGWARALGRRKT